MGRSTFSVESYRKAREDYGVTHDTGVTEVAEKHAQETGRLSEIVDPAINPIRRSLIRLDPHQKKWIATIGCPMDIEVSCDTTGSMGSEVDTEMKVLPDLYKAVAKVLPGYDPQLCLGIFGDVCDDFVMCRPQFEMEAPKIVNYLKEMAPQRDGGDTPEDPQYAMFARAYLTDAYTNRIGLKGYHFIVTDAPCHHRLNRSEIERIFGKDIFDNELKNMTEIPTMEEMIKDLKDKAHQFILVISANTRTVRDWCDLCGSSSVIKIDSTRQLPAVISAIIGLTEGTMDIADLERRIDYFGLASQLYRIDIGAQAKLRHALPHPVPKAGDIFRNKGDLWPIQPGDEDAEEKPLETPDHIEYL
ncbi:hypothetical protein J6V85_01600 [Candidatus Saccharibacteria bacterium]|nr:hypothetical protein [Candidatus Saccharibacteria bacterium]